MAKEKKRGFFSWLGFGRDEEKNAEPEEQQKETADVTAEPGVPAEPEHVPDLPAKEETAGEGESTPKPVDGEPAEATPSLPEAVDEPRVHDASPDETKAVHETEPDRAEAVHDAAPDETEAVHEAGPDRAEVPESKPLISDADKAALSEPVEPELPGTSIEQPQSVAPVTQSITTPAIERVEADQPTPEAAPEIPSATETDDGQLVEQPELIEEVPETPEESSKISPEESEETVAETGIITEQERPAREGFFARLKRSLVKTRQNLGTGFIGLFRGKKIDDELFEELEEQLLIADVGVDTTRKIISNLTAQASRKQLRDAEALYGILKQEMSAILDKVEQPLDIEGKTPFVILMVGVNGVGKTTTIGKLARQYQSEGKSVMLAAGDTFRAAAVEQLEVWGQRNNIPVVSQHTGADSASVIFDAIQAAKSRGIDVLIADTAGRLQNKSHLMEELKKITRVMGKLDDSAPHEVMLTIDASTGQNAVSQTKLFHEAVGLTGITLTKLDGTAKGGVIFSVADQFGIPIRYIGVGESIDDLRPFKAGDFIEALFARED